MRSSDKASPNLKKNAAGGVIGNVMEWYDFGVYGYFAAIIGNQFFPSEDRLASTISAFGVFAAGYLMRPFGGIVFGHIGDRLGRKKALQLSIAMMAIPTVLMGLLPTHAQIGVSASFLLVFLRLLQGVSVGGEFIGSISFVTETAPEKHRGLYGSLTTFSAMGGILLGSAMATAIHGLLSPQDVAAWGWRVPFLFGVVVAVFSFWMRRGITESPDFEKLKNQGRVGRKPVTEALQSSPGEILHVFCLISGMGGSFYLLFLWWPTYLGTIVTPHIPHALAINTAATLLMVALTPLAGHLSDVMGRRKVLVASFLGTALCAYPFFVWTDYGVAWVALACQMVFAVLLSGNQGAMPATMAEMFPTRTRFSGVGMGYNISMSLFGGTVPLVSTGLIALTGDIRAPAYYLIALCLVSLAASWALRPAIDLPVE